MNNMLTIFLCLNANPIVVLRGFDKGRTLLTFSKRMNLSNPFRIANAPSGKEDEQT